MDPVGPAGREGSSQGGRSRLRGLRERTATEDEVTCLVDEGPGGRGQGIVIQRERATQDRGRASVVAGAIRSEGQVTRAVLSDTARADSARAAVDPARHDAGAGAADSEGKASEVHRARALDDGRITGRGSLEGRNGGVGGELEDRISLVVEVDERARDRAVDGVADIERIGVIQHQDAAARTAAADVRITEVGIDAVELQRAATLLGQLAEAVEADSLREGHRVGVRGAVRVELEAAAQDDAREVRRRADIAISVGDRGRDLEVGVEAEEVDLTIAEDRPRVGDRSDDDAAVGAVLGHARAALVGIIAGDRRIQGDVAVGVVRRGAGEDERGIAFDAIGEGEVRAAAAEAVERLAVLDVREERTVVGQVFVGAEDEAGGVGGTEVERFVLGRDAERDRAEGAVADLVDDGGLDAREARDDGTVVPELNDRRGTETGQRVESITTRTDGVGARPAGIVASEVDRTVAPAAARGEVVITVELGADGREGARRTDRGVAHQVQRTGQGRVRAEANHAVERAGLAGAFFPTGTDNIPVASGERDVVGRQELAAVIAIDIDVAIEARAERRGDRGAGGANTQAADVSVTRIGIVRTEDEVVGACADADVTTEGDVGGASSAFAEDGVDRERLVAVSEDHELLTETRDDRATRDRGIGTDGGSVEDTARGDRDRITGGDRQRGAVRVRGVIAQGVDRLRRPTGTGVRLTHVDVLGDRESLGRIRRRGGGTDGHRARTDGDNGGSGRDARTADARTDDESRKIGESDRRGANRRCAGHQRLGVGGRRRRRGGIGRGHEPAAGVLGGEVGGVVTRGA